MDQTDNPGLGAAARRVRFEEMFPWEISAAMAEAPLCYLPLGTLEWHGEHAAVGLDALKAHAVCVRAAERSGGLVVPPLYWSADWRGDLPDGGYLTGGIEQGERYHVPGSMFWVRPETFRNLLLDTYEAMSRRGFRAIVVLSGHWNFERNIAAIRATGEEFRREHPATGWLLLTDQGIGHDLGYPVEHAAGGETSLLMAIRPDLVALDKTLETDRSLRARYPRRPRTNTSASTPGSRTPPTTRRGRRSSAAGRCSRPSSGGWRQGRGRS